MKATLISTACPTFFKATLATEGITPAAIVLARHVATLSPDDAGPSEWAAELQNLADMIPTTCWTAAPVATILAWFDDHMPRIMAEVPKSQRRDFALGICSAVREHGIDIVDG